MKLTEQEHLVLMKLKETWNEWLKLDGSTMDDNFAFRRLVHQAQYMVGVRVARRADPDVWNPNS